MEADGSVILRDVTVRYGRIVALEAITGRFEPGSLTAVVGANGAGKSTLLAAITGAVRLSRGSVQCAVQRHGCLAWLPQRATLDSDFPIMVEELIALGAWREFGALRAPPASLQERVIAAAATVGWTGRLRRRVGTLSVGELQRALFARLILQDAAVILLDEPFAAVDTSTTSVLLDQVTRWHDEGRTVIAVLHDLDLVRARFPSTLVVARHCVAWGPTSTALPAMAA
jgi:zinc/manganese transport system ATP-binding protein